MDLQKLRAWWFRRQGLAHRLDGTSPAEVLRRTGWARTVGGSNPYLTLFARAGIDRATADRAAAEVAICELPSARGCTYLLPAEDYAVGLAAGAGAPRGELAAAIKHLDVTETEIDRLGEAVLSAVTEADEPLQPQDLRDRLGDAVRSLGEAGRKRGVSSTLPLALGLLQSAGELRRVPVDGRLDQQRYGYTRWTPSPLADADLDPDHLAAELARRYFAWAGPATLAHFRWFSGLGAAVAKRALAATELTDLGDGLLLPADQVAEYEEFTAPADPEYALVGWIDGIHLLHRDLGRLLDPADVDRPSPLEPAKRLGELKDPPCQLIMDRGRIVGLWEFDPTTEAIVSRLFVPEDDGLRTAIAETERFIVEQLGDARGSVLDSPKVRSAAVTGLLTD
ncbi:DNA glycosylase AlkZ-like family protein [Microlunatus sp. GCM10028923]|uniref:DNA glycosylase AlkZ-like family protein n=1 Tax=Microlunatus sp. GCM10028923 TaxID=3273400 RepID=UPI003615367D